MASVIIILTTALNAYAIIMEPTFQAAESMGYQVVGEVEFAKGSVSLPPFDRHLTEIAALCPRTGSSYSDASSPANIVILAWGDADYPTKKQSALSSRQRWLALKRATETARRIEKSVSGTLNFELVNMASRKPHYIDSALPDRPGRGDVKSSLENFGAAPSDALGLGLFAEYSQAAKSVIWVACRESLVRKRSPSARVVQLASAGKFRTGF